MRTTRSPFPVPMPMPGEFRLSCAPFTFSSVWMWNHNFLCNCKRQQLTAIPRVVIGGYASSAAIDISTTNIRWIILSSFPARFWSAGKRGEGGKGGFSLQFFLFLVFFSRGSASCMRVSECVWVFNIQPLAVPVCKCYAEYVSVNLGVSEDTVSA